ncbi:MAG: hypothetical protein R6V12_10920 [Candidatus Hydrogenedentota bacterium]
MRPLAFTSLVLVLSVFGALAQPSVPRQPVPVWTEQNLSSPDGRFHLGHGGAEVAIWGRGSEKYARAYFDEFLPALFERYLEIDEPLAHDSRIEWIFTGPLAGFTVTVEPSRLQVTQHFYDSFALNTLDDNDVKAGRHPEKTWRTSEAALENPVRSVSVTLDHRLGLIVGVNGAEVLRQVCEFEVSRHQLRFTGPEQTGLTGSVFAPEPVDAAITIDNAQHHQKMIGFGGICTPTAYAQLSEEGKRRWWKLVCEYNLLIQREYPIGTRLDNDMSNWEDLADATPHYYGDNFPNGEISDFEYIKTLREYGGKVWFEFWKLPPWATTEQNGETVPDPDAYARAMVGYCKTLDAATGAPPDVVGIQNEVVQPAPMWHAMTRTLRRELDAEGFGAVKIHMSDNGRLKGGIENAQAFRESAEAWSLIDYAATHMYDYQNFFTEPDGYDGLLRQWHELTSEKPFLSTELCINSPRYQLPTYRLAFAMGQLYHKNLAITDAAAICYCWTLLNVTQPSYGATRSLFVPDPGGGFIPKASSMQARVFGAFSRRVREGMTRIDAVSSSEDLLCTAFHGPTDALTVIIVNRGTRPYRIEPLRGFALSEIERVDPYHQNSVAFYDKEKRTTIKPGAIVTITSVPLGRP